MGRFDAYYTLQNNVQQKLYCSGYGVFNSVSQSDLQYAMKLNRLWHFRCAFEFTVHIFSTAKFFH